MKCPLLTLIEYAIHEGKLTRTLDCLKEECAWWIGYDKACVLVSLNNEERVIRVALKDIEYKMPTEVQFRK